MTDVEQSMVADCIEPGNLEALVDELISWRDAKFLNATARERYSQRLAGYAAEWLLGIEP